MQCLNSMKDVFGCRKSFTLVEMLVAIAIIAILAGILLAAVDEAKAKAQRMTCMDNLRQINLGVRMYADESNDKSPNNGLGTFRSYKEVMKSYVALHGPSSIRDKVFACPADTFFYSENNGYTLVPHGHHEETNYDFSSYTFNGLNLLPADWSGVHNIGALPGIGGIPLASVKHPEKTLLIFEAPALSLYSWHKPKRPLGPENSTFNNALDMVSYVDGHENYIRMYWNSAISYPGPDHWRSAAFFYDPPVGYDYQWSGD
jgi:prepilin-type N-terminal cleavage/methylation domain-containing protein